MIKEGRKKIPKETMAEYSPKGICEAVCVCVCVCVCMCEFSIVFNSLRPHGLQPSQLLYPWDSPGKNIGVGCTPPGDLSNPGIEPVSPALQVDFLLSEQPWKPHL